MQNRHPIIVKIVELATKKETPETIKQIQILINTALSLKKTIEEERQIIQSGLQEDPSLIAAVLPPSIDFEANPAASPLLLAIQNGNLTIASLLSTVTQSQTDAIFAALEKGFITFAAQLIGQNRFDKTALFSKINTNISMPSFSISSIYFLLNEGLEGFQLNDPQKLLQRVINLNVNEYTEESYCGLEKLLQYDQHSIYLMAPPTQENHYKESTHPNIFIYEHENGMFFYIKQGKLENIDLALQPDIKEKIDARFSQRTKDSILLEDNEARQAILNILSSRKHIKELDNNSSEMFKEGRLYFEKLKHLENLKRLEKFGTPDLRNIINHALPQVAEGEAKVAILPPALVDMTMGYLSNNRCTYDFFKNSLNSELISARDSLTVLDQNDRDTLLSFIESMLNDIHYYCSVLLAREAANIEQEQSNLIKTDASTDTHLWLLKYSANNQRRENLKKMEEFSQEFKAEYKELVNSIASLKTSSISNNMDEKKENSINSEFDKFFDLKKKFNESVILVEEEKKLALEKQIQHFINDRLFKYAVSIYYFMVETSRKLDEVSKHSKESTLEAEKLQLSLSSQLDAFGKIALWLMKMIKINDTSFPRATELVIGLQWLICKNCSARGNIYPFKFNKELQYKIDHFNPLVSFNKNQPNDTQSIERLQIVAHSNHIKQIALSATRLQACFNPQKEYFPFPMIYK